MFLKTEYLAVKNLEIISAPQLLSGALSGTISGAISPGGPSEMRVLVRSRAGTALLGRLLAQNVRGGFSVGLSGEMGAGKTEFVRGIVKALGSRDLVTSPTYILEAEYGLELPAAAEGNEGDRDRKLQPPLGDITQVAVDRGINLISHWDLFRLAPPSVDPCSNISREIPPDLVARLQAPDVLTIVEWPECVEGVLDLLQISVMLAFTGSDSDFCAAQTISNKNHSHEISAENLTVEKLTDESREVIIRGEAALLAAICEGISDSTRSDSLKINF